MVTDQMLKDLEYVLSVDPETRHDLNHKKTLETFRILDIDDQLVLIDLAGKLRDFVKSRMAKKGLQFSVIGALEVLCAVGRLQVLGELHEREYGG